MKRRREVEKKRSELKSAIEELSFLAIKLEPVVVVVVGEDDLQIKQENAQHIPIKPFLFLSNFLLHLLDKIGPTMAVLRQDIYQNIQRLEKMQETDPILYSNVVEILKKEATEGTAKKATSSSKAFLWLTRSLDFTVHLLNSIAKDFGLNMEQAVEESYQANLKPWHGWISSTAYKVALKLVPDNQTSIEVLMANIEDKETLKEDIQTLTSLLTPFLDKIHSVLETYGLDRLKAT